MTRIKDTLGRDAKQFLEEAFEFETCDECGGDVAEHDAVPMTLGAYSDGVLFFARCKTDTEAP